MNIELEQLLHRPVDLVIEGDLLPFAEETENSCGDAVASAGVSGLFTLDYQA